MEHDLDLLFARAKDPRMWSERDDLARAGLVSPEVVLFQLRGVLGTGAAALIDGAMQSLIPDGGCSMFWDVSGLRSYSPEVRDTALAWLRKRSDQIRKIHIHASGAPWTVRMGINLANLILIGRIETHDRPTSFSAALTLALDA